MGPCVRRDDDEVAEWLIFEQGSGALCREKRGSVAVIGRARINHHARVEELLSASSDVARLSQPPVIASLNERRSIRAMSACDPFIEVSSESVRRAHGK